MTPDLLQLPEGLPYGGGAATSDLTVEAGRVHARKRASLSGPPTAAHDSDAGYEVGSEIFDAAALAWYKATAVTPDAAQWVCTGGSGGVGSPAGSGTELQYRVSGTTFGAVAGSSWDGTTLALPKSTFGGVASLPLGSASAPALTFTGDVNTGLYSPGAGTLALAANGAEVIRLTSGQLVGIYESNPQARLHIGGGQVFIGTPVNKDSYDLLYSAGGYPGFRMEVQRASGGAAAAFLRGYASKQGATGNALWAEIGVLGDFGTGGVDAAPVVGYLYFGCETTVSFSNNTFRLYPDKKAYFDGYVGIGTASPSNMLHIKGTAAAIELEDSVDGVLGYIANANDVVSGTAGMLAIRAEDGLYFSGGGNAQHVFVKSDGTVGVGTTSPQATLHVYNATYKVSVHFGDIINTTDGSRCGIGWGTSGGQIYWDQKVYASGHLYCRIGAGTQAAAENAWLTVTGATGYVGFNRVTPDFQVDINNASGNCLRLHYNNKDGVAANYADFTVSSLGYLTIASSGGVTTLSGTVISPFGSGSNAYRLLGGGNIGSTGAYNLAVGPFAGYYWSSGGYNVAFGGSALYDNSTGEGNVAVGYYCLKRATGSTNVGLGRYAGCHETGSNTFYVNNTDEASSANDKAYSLLYGTFSGTAGSLTGQTLTVNATTFTANAKAQVNRLRLLNKTELTIASGAVTATRGFHTVDTEGDAASDDLDTINGGEDGDVLVIRANHTDRTVVAKDGTGNLALNGDCTLDASSDTLTLIYDGDLSKWVELARSGND